MTFKGEEIAIPLRQVLALSSRISKTNCRVGLGVENMLLNFHDTSLNIIFFLSFFMSLHLMLPMIYSRAMFLWEVNRLCHDEGSDTKNECFSSSPSSSSVQNHRHAMPWDYHFSCFINEKLIASSQENFLIQSSLNGSLEGEVKFQFHLS